ncbi:MULTISPECIES: hypothetical protein [Gammaproteobacteria]|jgi:hypothetical protein|uniref:hypothetical protein n=1 Tax=Gammaproteobacteria TaxID=1236 RepID=UPI000E0AFF5A|nr:MULTISPECIES: hypothetical protein [Gammaproteobacteria]EBO0058356.1 hypothetical protein [Salmonella enterica]EEX4872011.1 hypothetical protein [Salmonella enterica subsp. enterica serovar 4,[5],12:i:-]EKO3572701.1 hypothetical protein [Vibrio metschnikovii]HBC3491268.1 hypothetical protein [Vibrio alginolyticus]HBX6772005.1 hypothetical protein [Klebsiella pneumoniae]
MTVPLWEAQRMLHKEGEQAIRFSVHKYNPYNKGRKTTLEEAVRCLAFQSRFAGTHSFVDSETKEPMHLQIDIASKTDVPMLGMFLSVYISDGKEKYLSQFIVSESKSHYFFLDFSLAAAKAKSIEV